MMSRIDGGQHEQRDVERHGAPPVGEHRRPARSARRPRPVALVGDVDRRVPVLAVDADVHDAGPLAEHEQRLAATTISSSSDLPCHGAARGEAAMTLKSPSVTASAKRLPMPPWSTVRSRMSRLAAAVPALSSGSSIMRVDEFAGRQRQHRLGVALDIVVPVDQRQEAHRRDDHQEDDDQCRDRTLEQRLGGEQAAIGGLGDDARIAARTAFLAGPAPDKNRSVGRAPRVRIRPLIGSPVPAALVTIRQRRTPESSS